MLGVRTLECLFDGMIPKSDPQNYPMQSYLRTVVVNLNMRQLGGIDPHMLVFVSDRALLGGPDPLCNRVDFTATHFCSSISSQEESWAL